MAPAAMIGKRIGPYEVVDKLGEGGMGQVYRAHDHKLDRDVALKVLPEGFATDADRLMRFTREARTLAALNHPHIAQVYDAGGEGSTAYIAMEFVDGEDLTARIGRGAIPVSEALTIARQIADALAAAHDAGVVHRDLYTPHIDFNRRAVAFAKAHDKPLVGNTDLHRLDQLGTTYSLVNADPDPDAICDAIRAGRVEVRTEPVGLGRAGLTLTRMAIGGLLGRADLIGGRQTSLAPAPQR